MLIKNKMLTRDSVWERKTGVGPSFIRIDRAIYKNINGQKVDGYVYWASKDNVLWDMQTTLLDDENIKFLEKNYEFLRIETPVNDKSVIESEQIEKEPEANRLSQVMGD